MSNPFDINLESKNVTDPRVLSLAEKLKSIWAEVKTLNREAHVVQSKQYNKSTNVYNFKVGDKVWLQNPRVLPKKSKKVTKKYVGPYQIVSIISPVTVKIQLKKVRP
jgi:ribonuclease HIII